MPLEVCGQNVDQLVDFPEPVHGWGGVEVMEIDNQLCKRRLWGEIRQGVYDYAARSGQKFKRPIIDRSVTYEWSPAK